MGITLAQCSFCGWVLKAWVLASKQTNAHTLTRSSTPSFLERSKRPVQTVSHVCTDGPSGRSRKTDANAKRVGSGTAQIFGTKVFMRELASSRLPSPYTVFRASGSRIYVGELVNAIR